MVTRRVIEVTCKSRYDAPRPAGLGPPQQTAKAQQTAEKMRQIRSKAYRKLMAMYSTSFGFRQPYQVLCAFLCQLEAKNAFLFITPPLLRVVSR